MKIEYGECDGNLRFSYFDHEYMEKKTGTIPKDVVSRGELVIRRYVESKIASARRKWEEEVIKKEAIEKSTNIAISVMYRGRMLSGRILHCQDGHGGIKVILEKPHSHAGENRILMCFGLGMAGIQIYTDEGIVSLWGIERAKKSLIEIYEKTEKLRHPVAKLAAKLNVF